LISDLFGHKDAISQGDEQFKQLVPQLGQPIEAWLLYEQYRSKSISILLRYTCIPVAGDGSSHHVSDMCGRVIQSSAPIKYGIVDGLNVRYSLNPRRLIVFRW